MRFIITSGSTFTPWDGVRGITNLSKGTTGAKIAEEALLNGHRVDYIANEYAKQPFELRINPSNLGDIKSIKKARSAYRNYTYHKAKTFDDYLKTCLDIPGMDTNEKTVFISSAAVSDYSPKKEKGKVSSNEENISLELGRLPKVIKEVKSKYLLMPVVGFKLLSTETSTLSELIEVAYKSLLDSRLALVVANLVDENFKPTCTVIITPEKNIIPIAKREDLAPKLVELIEQRLDCDFYKTEIAESLPSDIDTKPFLNLIKECSNYALFSSYGDGRKDAEFGSIAMRTPQGILTSGRGTTKANADEENIALIKNISDGNITLASNGVKATLNAPTLWHILQDRPEINYVIHAHVYLPNGDYVEKNSSPGTDNDYEVIEKLVKSGSNMINQVGHGCLMLLKEKDELFDILKANGLYNSQYSKYYDMAYYRFEKGILENSIEELNLNKNIDVLDLACGTGKSAQELQKLGFTNVDIADASKDMLAVAEARTCKSGVVATFEDLSSIKKQYDLITIRQAFPYLNRDKVKDFIIGVHSKLKTGGYLAFNTFKVLDEGISAREDEFASEGLLLKTTEKNIIKKDEIIHSQRTEYLNCQTGEYIPLYDINVFNNYDLEEFKPLFEQSGFEVEIKARNKSVCFIARKK